MGGCRCGTSDSVRSSCESKCQEFGSRCSHRVAASCGVGSPSCRRGAAARLDAAGFAVRVAVAACVGSAGRGSAGSEPAAAVGFAAAVAVGQLSRGSDATAVVGFAAAAAVVQLSAGSEPAAAVGFAAAVAAGQLSAGSDLAAAWELTDCPGLAASAAGHSVVAYLPAAVFGRNQEYLPRKVSATRMLR